MSTFSEIYCIIKVSELDYHLAMESRKNMFHRLDESNQNQVKKSHENQTKFIENLKTFSKKLGMKVHFLNEDQMDQIHPGCNDLIISCGGDGTFLSCAQKYQDSILLGMNSDYKPKAGVGSYGALTSINRTNLKRRLEEIKDQKFFIDQWKRLQTKVNNQLIERYAVNEIYFGQRISYETCDINIQHSRMSQDFNCSGVLTCTGMGSHAWHYNAGGSPFSNELDAFGFKVLFPNLKRTLKFASGIVSGRNELIIYPLRDNYVLSYDSKSDVITTQLGDEVRISLAPDSAVRVISFHD